MEKVVKQYFIKCKEFLNKQVPDFDSIYANIKSFFGDSDYDIFTSIITSYLYPNPKVDLLTNISYIPEYFMYNNPCHIQSLVIPDNIKEFKMGAFIECTDLRSVIFNRRLDHIGDGAFRGCNRLDNIVIPSNIEIIHKGAFSFCHSLSKVRFNEGLRSIDNYAFEECPRLKEFTIPKSVEYIGTKALPYGPSVTASVYRNTYGEIWATRNNCKISYLD